MLVFRVNKYITLSLEDGKTVIYVNGEEFTQCKHILLNIPVENINSFESIKSIDDASFAFRWSEIDQESIETYIPPEVEFWGHCSNIQTWSENNYDTRLIHSNLGFPLLKKLTDIGDESALKVFKCEIIKRFIEGNEFTKEFLIDRGYIKYLAEKDIRVVIPVEEVLVIEDLEKKINVQFSMAQYLEEITEPERPKNRYYIENYKIVGLKIVSMVNYGKFLEIITGLKELKYLNLSNNNFFCIPESIGELKNLEFLDLSDNDLTHIPETFRKLTNLKELNMWENKMEDMPYIIENIKTLEILYLRDNPITEFPKTFGDLKKRKNSNDYTKVYE